MVRGLYTGASAMAARVQHMNVVANNLANVNTNAFKKDLALMKAEPEMIARRVNDDVIVFPSLGSYDKRPVVGRLGTGVSLNEVFNRQDQGALRATQNPFDFALQGKGFFAIQTDNGIRYTRNGAFTLNNKKELVTSEGHRVLGLNGVIVLKTNNFTVQGNGDIFINKDLAQPEERPVQLLENGYQEPFLLDRLQIVRFPQERFLIKEGNSFYKTSETSGQALLQENFAAFARDGSLLPDEGHQPVVSKLNQGFLETSNVNAVQEMVTMIEVQRSYEASQKSITTSDEMLGRLINSMASFQA